MNCLPVVNLNTRTEEVKNLKFCILGHLHSILEMQHFSIIILDRQW